MTTVTYDIFKVVEGYNALTYSCGIPGSWNSKRWPDAINIGSDGSPIITVIPYGDIENTTTNFVVLWFDGQVFPNDMRIQYNLEEIKQLFKASLAGKRVVPKQINERGVTKLSFKTIKKSKVS